MHFKPMLSASLDGVDLSTLRYPLVVSPKLDGYRCIIWEGVAYSRNAKPLRNRFLQKWVKDNELHNLDGELIVGPPTGGEVLGRSAAVNAFDGEPDFTFHCFDAIERHYSDQLENLDWMRKELGVPRLSFVEHCHIAGPADLLLMEEHWLEQGYEGVMLRRPGVPYKHGRSTLREGYLMKLKRFQDGEAVVTGLEEGMINDNALERDELGRAKRSKRADGLRPSGMVGTILATDPKWGPLRIAPGIMSHKERKDYWGAYQFELSLGGNQCRVKGADKPTLIGKTIHWRSFGYGVKDAPRFARYYGIREDV